LLPGTPLNGNSTTISASAAIAAASAAVTPTKSSLTTLPTLVSVAGTSVAPGRVWQLTSVVVKSPESSYCVGRI
jgi:hypothetical protein